MSRIGKQIIEIPTGTTVTVNNNVVTIKGPKGELSRQFRPVVEIVVEGNTVSFVKKQESAFGRS